jgi:hypothetical protein
MPDADLETLTAVEQIKQLKARYFRFMDTKQWDRWREVFTDDLEASFETDAGGPTQQLGRTADEVVATVSARFARARTVHHGHMPEIQLTSPTSATGIWAMNDVVEHPPDGPLRSIVSWGHYHEEYRRGDDGRWRISRFHLTRLRFEPLHPA